MQAGTYSTHPDNNYQGCPRSTSLLRCARPNLNAQPTGEASAIRRANNAFHPTAMTAVAAFVSENRPLMVGDLLLSSDTERDSTIQQVLPTTNLIPDEINELMQGCVRKSRSSVDMF